VPQASRARKEVWRHVPCSTLCTQISVIATGKLVFTGPTQDLGADLDTFEDSLIELLTSPIPVLATVGVGASKIGV
jgi:hypothetical protein